ncbi:MAG: DUF6445 family protein [Bdellovibrionota bacterium]
MLSYDQNVIIVDDFYQNPDRIREFGLARQFGKGSKDNFCGVQSENLELPNLKTIFRNLLKASRLRFDRREWVFGAFRKAQLGDTGKSHIHFDPSDWSAVIYLSKVVGQVGTSFYRHKKTGLLGPTNELRRTRPWPQIREDGERIINGESKIMHQWELTHQVEFRFNRLVLFRGRNFFHAPGPAFGSDSESCRLTQHFFFDVE